MLRSRRARCNRANNSHGDTDELTPDFYARKMNQAFGSIIEALDDRDVEARVLAHFRENPQLSRAAKNVAAVAVQFKRQKILDAHGIKTVAAV